PTDPSGWVDQYGDYLFRYALVRVRRREVAEDLVQETFLGALRGRKQFTGASSERTWLIGILRHKIGDYLRRQRRGEPAGRVTADPWIDELFDRRGHWKRWPRRWSNPSSALEDAEFWNVFARCLAKLPTPLARAFSLREVDGMPGAEVCKVLDIAPTNMWVM